jgi:serine/threonine protein kinase
MLAVGGYATIFRARQESVGREVAVKVENFTLESERDQARFVREARATGRMSSHPHVVDLFDAGVTADNHPYLIMELCAGSYQDLMPLRPQVVRDIGMKIADSLADAHERGIVHRRRVHVILGVCVAAVGGPRPVGVPRYCRLQWEAGLLPAVRRWT